MPLWKASTCSISAFSTGYMIFLLINVSCSGFKLANRMVLASAAALLIIWFAIFIGSMCVCAICVMLLPCWLFDTLPPSCVAQAARDWFMFLSVFLVAQVVFVRLGAVLVAPVFVLLVPV